VEVDGVDERWGPLIALAWSRTGGRLPPGVAGLLAPGDAQLDLAEEARGSLDASDLLELADYLVMHGAEGLLKWRKEIETEVERRATLEGGAPAGTSSRSGFGPASMRSARTEEAWSDVRCLRDGE
jgi:hypothetical protein